MVRFNSSQHMHLTLQLLCWQVTLYWRADLAPIVQEALGLPSLEAYDVQLRELVRKQRAAEEQRKHG